MSSKRVKIGRLSLTKRCIFWSISIFFGVFVAGGALELLFRALEYAEQTTYEGSGGRFVADERWGWRPSKGEFRIVSPEFDQKGFINDLYMNDDPLEWENDEASTRILVLGDSHTFAAGVSTNDSWPQVLVRLLESRYSPNRFRTYNTAFPNYSLHQYLLRLIDQGPLVRPDYVVVGLSYATDLYDLIPPSHGGWYGGSQWERDYFDLDQNGVLELRHWNNPANAVPSELELTVAYRAREFLGYFATFRYLRRSKLALYIGARVRPGGKSLWPNMEIVLEREISPEHKFVWRLFQALLLQMRHEAQRLGAKFVVVGIPYLPQVYDEIWDVTFAGNDSYSRDAANERVSAWAREYAIHYVETLSLLRKRSSELDRWLHHRNDAHPNSEGHKIIAKAIVDQFEMRPRR